MLKRGRSRKAQLSVFVIIAVVIFAIVLLYFGLRGRISIDAIPAEMKPIEKYFLDCVEEEADIGVMMLGERGGYIYPPEFEPGSSYSPTSNQLDFFGFPVSYWYYVSGNNIEKEQVPSKKDMEEQLEMYIEENLECDFSNFEEEGFEINLDREDMNVKVDILDNKVEVEVDGDLDINFYDDNVRISNHVTEADSLLGSFYDEALKIYNYEKTNLFLEKYSIDVLRLYAPVDGVELSCSPKVWLENDIKNEIKEGLMNNIQTIKMAGDYYSLKNKEREYFVEELKVDERINFLYSDNWPTKIEISNENNGVLIAEPVGIQEGLGILGFCYVPYHFVYDLEYPVLIQVYDNQELFQFPIGVVIRGNNPRKALDAEFYDNELELCKYKNEEISVYTYDLNLNPVEARISFECLRQRCDIGETKREGEDAVLREKFPQCVNGFINAGADGYVPASVQYTTTAEGVVDILMDRLYEVEVELKRDSVIASDSAVIVFNSRNNKKTVAWPEMSKVELSEGGYNITVYTYRNSNIIIPSTTSQNCVDVPKPGFAGIFGAKEEQCYEVTIPSQTIQNVISGGGKTSWYILESDLRKGKITLDVDSLPIPNTLEELQNNYHLLEEGDIHVSFG